MYQAGWTVNRMMRPVDRMLLPGNLAAGYVDRPVD